MTFVRPAPAAGRRVVRPVTDTHRGGLEALVAEDPIVNAVIAARLAAFGSIDRPGFGGTVLGVPDADGGLRAAAFDGGNLLPIGGDLDDWDALARAVAASGPRRCTSIVGRADAVTEMWHVLEPEWGPARGVRECQPLLVLARGEGTGVVPDPRLQMMRLTDLERYLPAAAAMFTEELGVSPFAGSGSSYRRRVEALLANGRGYGIVDDDGQIMFKADLGAVTRATCQIQGVWVRPDLRGRGLGTAALAGVLQHALRLAPSVSLYVNDFNVAARRMYARLGLRELATLATVLL